jgi:hypothetical protein
VDNAFTAVLDESIGAKIVTDRATISACLKTVTTLDQRSSVALPPEALDALGVEAGAEVEVEIIGWGFARSRKPNARAIHKHLRIDPL